jgi:hypothetical protein
MRGVKVQTGQLTVTRFYPDEDAIWSLPLEKRQRKLIADAQRDLALEADRLSNEKIVERG